MAHIVNCIAGSEPSWPQRPSNQAPSITSAPTTSGFDRSYVPRTAHLDQQRRYQFFPKEKNRQAVSNGKVLDPEKAFATAMSQNGEKREKPNPGGHPKLRLNQYNLVRRRKVSVPELGPMTTVQEVAMDSRASSLKSSHSQDFRTKWIAATIPGRPPLHERSSSAPEDVTKPKRPIPPSGPTTRVCEIKEDEGVDLGKSIEDAFAAAATIPAKPIHERFIPAVNTKPDARAPFLRSHTCVAPMRSDSTPPGGPRRPVVHDVSPLSHTHFAPSVLTPDLTCPASASTESTSVSTLPTPVSAPGMDLLCPSAHPWDARSATDASHQTEDGKRTRPLYGHRRGVSESASVMDRGRPRDRVETERKNSASLPKSSDAMRNESLERRTFEDIPDGVRPSDAVSRLGAEKAAALQKQAHQQAQSFEVLTLEDVEALTKELRNLDERTEYLRRTYTSLRIGRRNLHSRIFQYLRSRVARFSHETMLKQEEALAELDASIDDWIMKLEQFENRRNCVRQKLFEHVAAAAILSVPNGTQTVRDDASLHQVALSSPIPADISTPPRRPSKQTFALPAKNNGSPASQQGDAAVSLDATPMTQQQKPEANLKDGTQQNADEHPSPAVQEVQVPATSGQQQAQLVIEETPVDSRDSADLRDSRITSTLTLRRGDVESIRIYVGNDVYALLADVEDEITRMSSIREPTGPGRTERERQRSHEKLNGIHEAPEIAKPHEDVVVASVEDASARLAPFRPIVASPISIEPEASVAPLAIPSQTSPSRLKSPPADGLLMSAVLSPE